MTFIWKGKRLDTVGDIVDAVYKIDTEAEGAEFMRAYRAAEPQHADENAGYVIGYMGPAAVRQRAWRLLGVRHPVGIDA
jgi:hypothetical protein